MIDDAIIRPVKGRHPADIGTICVMTATGKDTEKMARTAGFPPDRSRPLHMSRLYFPGESIGPRYSLAGPIMGAPYAVMLMEVLLAWGVRRIIFFGWCGSLSPDVDIGDILIPTCAHIDEGTSRHYAGDEEKISPASDRLSDELKSAFDQKGILTHSGPIWSMDALYRETPRRVTYYQRQGALAVEMEMSALFTVGRFRGVEVAGVLVVSDSLSDLTWRVGFREKRFHGSRNSVCEVVNGLCQKMSSPH